MATLLLELFSEEIPSRMQRGAAEQLQRLIMGGIEKAGLENTGAKTFVSPRHLAIQVSGLPQKQPDVSEEKKGPKVGAPEQAMKGFLGSVGLTAEQCEQRDGYYFAKIERKGRPTEEVVKEICEAALNEFSWPKSMRWGARPMQWVRPLHRIVCLLDSAVVPVTFGHLTASNITHGHRFLAPQEIALKHADDYVEALRKAHVLVDREERRTLVQQQVNDAAAKNKLSVVTDEGLLDEVTGLVEWPTAYVGTFDEKFLPLPKEVLISEMKHHQRYFATEANGTLTNQFILVSNMVTTDGGKAVVSGNSRVLRARLSDGEFYWYQDQKTPLTDWAKKLSDVVFHAKVGMMDKEVEKTRALAVAISKEVGYKNTDEVKRAADLCKADLTSGMVGEFPDLQGIMGRYYAKAQKEADAVCEAIYEHYKPQGAGDSLPTTELGAIISVADKLRMIQSLFAAGEKPTGSKDPFALRRAALGILRIVLDKSWNLDFASFTPSQEILDFFHDRLKNVLKDEGIRHDIIEASFNENQAGFMPTAIAANAKALQDFTAKQQVTLAAIKRAMNILAAEEKKAKTQYQFAAAKSASFAKPAEQELHKALQQNVVSLDALATLAAPINKFFDDVMITEEGHKDARLSLLAGVREASMKIADFSKIEG
ncbi:MAG: glycine--tRNA ligase subunit beta [Alphaproteobacteria bacterium]|nr:glycine--tRNA ligase subunit beta [Alphaproteobacteria bacterium]